MFKKFVEKKDNGVIYIEPARLDLQPFKQKLVWALLIAIVVGNVYVIFIRDKQEARGIAVAATMEVLNQPKPFNESDAFKAFAEGFSNEFLTLRGEDDQYRDRLAPFSIGYQLMIDNQTDDRTQEVHSAQMVTSELISDDLAEASVSVAFTQNKLVRTEDESKWEKTSDRIRLNILIKETDKGLAVVAPPILEPEKEAPTTANRNYSGLYRVSENNSKPVRETIISYFNVLSTGKPHEISFYFTDNVDRTGFEGKWKFKNIEFFEAFELDGQDRIVVQVKSSWTESVLQYEFMQSHEFIMLKNADKSGKWFIESVSSRHQELEKKMEENNNVE